MTERVAGQIQLDMERVLDVLRRVIDRMTVSTQIGRIIMPGPTYLGMWARDTGVVCLGLNRLGRSELSGELLRRYWSYQIDEHSKPETFIFRNKRFAHWTEADAFRPTRDQLLREVGAFPTSVYIQTPDFPAGTREIYTVRADLDSVAWLIIALADYYTSSGDLDILTSLATHVDRAISYLQSRDEDGDLLLEQGANEDWADTLLRSGNVSYTQAVWYAALRAAGTIFAAVQRDGRADQCLTLAGDVAAAINGHLLSRYGYYVNYRTDASVSLRRSLDTALLVAFGVAPDGVADEVLQYLDTLEGPFGPSVIEPGYVPDDIGPSHYPPGQYHNEGVWPWISSYLALAQARQGQAWRAYDTICSLFGSQPETIFEWVDNLSGEQHHAEFATGAGALAWAITEGNLAHLSLGQDRRAG
ncbi:MAG: amylo-alpha-1,6-glucosidase [Chloroflexota bacterium]